MLQKLIEWFGSIPHEILIIILATLPLTELRASIPIGVTVFHLAPTSAYVLSVIGNMIPLVFLFSFLPWFLFFLSQRFPIFHTMLERYFFRLSKKHETKLNAYGALFLLVFVAIPHPGGGVWTASTLAILFRMKRSYAIPAIVCGTLISGFIVLSITLGSIQLFKQL